MEDRETNHTHRGDGRRKVALGAILALVLLSVYGLLIAQAGKAQEEAGTTLGAASTGAFPGSTTVMSIGGGQTQIIEKTGFSEDGGSSSSARSDPGAEAEKIKQDAEEEVCKELEDARKDALGALEGGAETQGMAAEIESRVNKDFEEGFALPEFCETGGDAGTDARPQEDVYQADPPDGVR